MSRKTATKKTGGTSSTPSFNTAAAEELFNTLCDPDDHDIMTMEGIAKFCELLEIDPAADVRALVLVWKLGASSKPGQITREEFINGCKQLNISDINGFKAYLPALDPGFLERSEFRGKQTYLTSFLPSHLHTLLLDFYRFSFKFSLEGTHKTIEKDMIVGLMPIVLDKDRAPHLTYFIDFLQQCSHTRITLDQWESFLQFNHTVKPDLSNWEDDGAWPLLLDEYVDWRKKK